MTSYPERRLQPRPLSNALTTRIPITRVNARVPMNRAEQRVALLIWVCSICMALLAVSEVCEMVDLALVTLGQSLTTR